MGTFSFTGPASEVGIGRDIIMGRYMSFHSENHCFDDSDRPIRTQDVVRREPVMEEIVGLGSR